MKYIIFDFDGVIEDTFELAYGINVNDFHTTLSRDEYRDLFMGNLFKNLETKRGSTVGSQNKFYDIQHEKLGSLKIKSNIKKHLENLSKEYKLFIVSSNLEKSLKLYLKNNGIDNIFSEILGYETDKSKIKKFEILFEKYNFKAKESIFVTDTVGDILEGEKVGLESIAVSYGYHEKHRLENVNPYKIVDSFDEILVEIKNYSKN